MCFYSSAKDVTTGEEVAIKKIGRAFTDVTDAKRTLREIVLLRNMKHPNVSGVYAIPTLSSNRTGNGKVTTSRYRLNA